MTDPEGTDVIEYDALDRVVGVTRSMSGHADVVEQYAYNALGALKTNAGVAIDDQRPVLDLVQVMKARPAAGGVELEQVADRIGRVRETGTPLAVKCAALPGGSAPDDAGHHEVEEDRVDVAQRRQQEQ